MDIQSLSYQSYHKLQETCARLQEQLATLSSEAEKAVRDIEDYYKDKIANLEGVIEEREQPTVNMTQACAILSISKPTMYRYMREGRIHAHKVGHNNIFNTQEVKSLIQ